MCVYDVPESRWEPFCERFARDHRGKSVTLELTDNADDPGAEREVLARKQPLEEIKLVSGHDHGPRLVVVVQGAIKGPVDRPPERMNELTIAQPARLRLEQHDEHQGGILRVDSWRRRTLLLCFDEPLVPGIMDRMP